MEWADALLSKKWSGRVDGLDGYPLDCCDHKSTCGAKKLLDGLIIKKGFVEFGIKLIYLGAPG